MTPNTAEDGITALTYEAALAELDTLITKLEGGSIALEEAIGAYERGVVLAQHCAELLARTERRVSQLVVSASGAIGERPLEAESGPSSEPRGAAVTANPVRTPLPRIDPDDVPF
jgi:exodeoxyribonuclease VII small subunit